MKKIIFLLLVIFSLVTTCQPVESAQVFFDQEKTGIETVLIDGQNYITSGEADSLLGQDSTNDPYYLLLLRDVAYYANYYIQWDTEGIYLNTEQPLIECKTIGYSIQVRPIEAFFATPPNYRKTILCVFAIHGFEDEYNNDGQRLVQIAEQVISRYSDQPINFTRLIVVPCANPDGVIAGNSKNGFGRCNAQGIDINRDFDYNWGFINESRYQTGYTPFTTPESQLLRDLVLDEKPDIILDFHGWLDCCYSQDRGLKSLFTKTLDLGIEKPAYPRFVPQQGYFSGWASPYAKSALIEYPLLEENLLAEKTIQALNQIISQ